MKLNRVQALSKHQARKLATEAVADLTEADARDMVRDLRVHPAKVKHLNRRMCLRVIEWVDKKKSHSEESNGTSKRDTQR